MARIKILHVVGTLNFGGLENVAVNYIRYLDPHKFSFDYLDCSGKKGEYDEEIMKLGGKVIRFSCDANNILHFLNRLKDLIIREKYEIVHSHILFRSGVILKIAKDCGVKVRIAHSHTTQIDINVSNKKKMYQKVMRLVIDKYATLQFACGEEAGKFLFGKSYEKKGVLVRNGIDIKKYIFDLKRRRKMRDDLGIQEDCILLISVARLLPVKNHQFLLKIMHMLEISKKLTDVKLLIVGDGNQKENLEKIVLELGLKEKVIFLGSRTDVDSLLQAADFFLMPSLFEGLPLSLIEAQAAGLVCIASDKITKEVNVTGLVEFANINSHMDWINIICAKRNYERINTSDLLIEKGYDNEKNFKEISKLYLDGILNYKRLVNNQS